MKEFRLTLENVGQISKADINFGDLTVLVGPQATGKSISLQLLKLLVDKHTVLSELKKHNLDWQKNWKTFLDIYLGEGMGAAWNESSSKISWNGSSQKTSDLISNSKGKKDQRQKMFAIPAQRVLTLRNGWPRPFSDYAPGDPFSVREFSELSRRFLENSALQVEKLFPTPKRLKKELRDLISKNIFSKYGLSIERNGAARRLVLRSEGSHEESNKEEKRDQLPFMVWSAGQREFVPLLLGFYWLMPTNTFERRENKLEKIEWVVIEELEAGLHPNAVSTVVLVILELLRRNYRVCISTHSTHVLDVIWALQNLKQSHATSNLVLKMFGAKSSVEMNKLAAVSLQKEYKVYYFDRSGHTHDISQLDPGSQNPFEAEWGGMTEFSGKVSEVVSEAVTSADP